MAGKNWIWEKGHGTGRDKKDTAAAHRRPAACVLTIRKERGSDLSQEVVCQIHPVWRVSRVEKL